MRLFGFRWYGSPVYGSKPPKSPILGARIGIFKPNSRNRKTCILSNQDHRFQLNFAQWYRASNTLRGLSRQAYNKSKMANGRHIGKIEKSPYLSNGLADCHEIWHDDAYWPSPFHWPLKIWTYENPRWRMATILNIEKPRYLGKGITHRHKIWHDCAFWPSSLFCRLRGIIALVTQLLLTITEINLKKIFILISFLQIIVFY